MKKTQNSTFIYLGLKCALLYAYYSLLHSFGLGWRFKFWSYIILTPIVKYFYFPNLTTKDKFSKVFITSVLLDTIFAFFYFNYLLHWTGYWLILYIFALAPWFIGTEYLQYLILRNPEDSYIIKLSNNPSDFYILPVFIVSNLFISVFSKEPADFFSPWCLIYWLAIMMVSEFTFGILHALAHIHPYLRKQHMVHHEYKREDLNTFAHFYSEFSDSVLMNIPGFTNAILMVLFSTGSVPFKEIVISLNYTHHKYPTHQMNLGYFFEFDVIDMIMDRVRLCNFHNIHHYLADRNYSTYGFISDEVLFKVLDGIKNLYQSGLRSFKLYNSFKEGFSN